MMKQEYQDTIDQYILGEMTEEESRLFKLEVKINDDLKEQLEFTKCIRDAIISRCEKLALIKEWENFYEMKYYRRNAVYAYVPGNILGERSVGTAGNLFTNSCLYWVLGVVAAIIVILGAILFLLLT